MEDVSIWGHDNRFLSFDDEVDGVDDEGIEVPWDEILEGKRTMMAIKAR